MNGQPTPDELLEIVRRADQEYVRLVERAYLVAVDMLASRGRASMPAQLVQAIDAATDAREAWIRRVDDYCRGRS